MIVQISNYYKSLGPIETFAQIHRRAFSASVIKVNAEKIKVSKMQRRELIRYSKIVFFMLF